MRTHNIVQIYFEVIVITDVAVHNTLFSFGRWTGMADLATLLATNDPNKKSTMKSLNESVRSIPDLAVTVGMRANVLTILPWLKASAPVLIVSIGIAMQYLKHNYSLYN